MNETRMLVTRLSVRRAAPLPEAQVMVLAERLLSLAPELGLDGPDDVLEILDLWVSLTERAPASLYTQGLMRAVLSIQSWTLAARIAFLRRHLEGREVAPDDNTMAAALFSLDHEATR